jgi:CheY-like chemotaxis protein
LPKKTPLISIVDDDESVRETTKVLMRSLGYVADAFASAEEFLESGHVYDYSCLISDMQMPGMNGIELQNRLIAQGYRLPIIFITAYPEPKLRTRALGPATNHRGFGLQPLRSLVAQVKLPDRTDPVSPPNWIDCGLLGGPGPYRRNLLTLT